MEIHWMFYFPFIRNSILGQDKIGYLNYVLQDVCKEEFLNRPEIPYRKWDINVRRVVQIAILEISSIRKYPTLIESLIVSKEVLT